MCTLLDCWIANIRLITFRDECAHSSQNVAEFTDIGGKFKKATMLFDTRYGNACQ